jgi:hypothetical protein
MSCSTPKRQDVTPPPSPRDAALPASPPARPFDSWPPHSATIPPRVRPPEVSRLGLLASASHPEGTALNAVRAASDMLWRVEIAEFTACHAPRKPHPRPGDNQDVHRLLSTIDGVATMPCAESMVPAPRPGDPDSRHLWVIREDSLPVILETAPEVRPPPLSLGIAKHTNLTGGKAAACGGEVWVDEVDPHTLYVNGGSGRYPCFAPQRN